MNCSGLEKTFEEVYSEDTFKHVLSGQVVARALRARMLVQNTLVNHISNTIEEGKLKVSDLECLHNIAMKNGLNKEQIADVTNNDAVISMINVTPNYLKQKSKESRMARLWLLYIEYINIVKEF